VFVRSIWIHNHIKRWRLYYLKLAALNPELQGPHHVRFLKSNRTWPRTLLLLTRYSFKFTSYAYCYEILCATALTTYSNDSTSKRRIQFCSAHALAIKLRIWWTVIALKLWWRWLRHNKLRLRVEWILYIITHIKMNKIGGMKLVLLLHASGNY